MLGYFFFCLATIWSLIFSYSDLETIFLVRSSLLLRYGRPSMIFCAIASPIPGSASSSSLLAEFMSPKAPFFALILVFVVFGVAAACVPFVGSVLWAGRVLARWPSARTVGRVCA